jgi:hypothetical protein
MCSNKGVQVELGIPYELWDKPSAEVSKMHRAVSNWISLRVYKLTMVYVSIICVYMCDHVL